MNSIILQTVTRLLIVILIVFSLFLLLRGHNEPGGGFSGGLVITVAFALHAVAFTSESTRRLVRVEPLLLVGAGLAMALISGGLGMLGGEELLTGQWLSGYVLGVKIGTPLLFDIGVYVLVIGMATGVLLELMEGA